MMTSYSGKNWKRNNMAFKKRELSLDTQNGPRQANLVLIAYATSEGSGELSHPRSLQNLRCSLIQAMSHEEPSDRKPDPWPLWTAGHAQLKFVMTECSKTQIRLTGLKYHCTTIKDGMKKVDIHVASYIEQSFKKELWERINWAPSSEFVSSSIPSWQILTAHALPFRGTRDLAFCLKVPLDSLLVWASSGGSGETARMRRLAWTFAARTDDKYQIRLTRLNWNVIQTRRPKHVSQGGQVTENGFKDW